MLDHRIDMTEFKCSECEKVMGHHFWGTYQELPKFVCVECHNKDKSEDKSENS